MSNKPEENLEKHFVAMKHITDMGRELAYLSKCLAAVGNTQLSEDLLGMSKDIDTCTEDARNAFTEEIMGRWSDGQSASDNMVKAALAGVVLGSEKPVQTGLATGENDG